MSIASEITRIQNAKTALKSSIEAKGVSVPAEAKIDTYPGYVDTISGGGGTEISGQEEITVEFGEDLSEGDAVTIAEKLSFEGSITHLPGGVIPAVMYTNAESFKCVQHDKNNLYTVLCSQINSVATSNIYLLRRINNTFIKMHVLSDGAANPNQLAMNADATFMVVACSNSPSIGVYKREGDILVKLPNPSYIPASYVLGVAITSDERYVYFTNNTSPYFTIYEKDGDTLNRLTVSTAPLASTPKQIELSSDDTYMATCHMSAPFISIYKRNGIGFTRLTSIDVLPAVEAKSVSFSLNANYMAVALNSSTLIFVYKRTGDNFVLLPALPDLPTSGIAQYVNWNIDGTILFLGVNSTPHHVLYKRDGDTFTRFYGIASPSYLAGIEATFTQDNNYMFAKMNAADNRLVLYKGGTSLGFFAYKSNNNIKNLSNVIGSGYAKESGLAGEEKKVIKIWG